MKKNRLINNSTKVAGPSVQGIVKTQLELVRVKNYSLFPNICNLHYSLTVVFPRLK